MPGKHCESLQYTPKWEITLCEQILGVQHGLKMRYGVTCSHFLLACAGVPVSSLIEKLHVQCNLRALFPSLDSEKRQVPTEGDSGAFKSLRSCFLSF